MKKGRSNRTAADKSFGLSKADILRGRKNFERLFEGSATVYSEPGITLRFHLFTDRGFICKMGFIAAKKLDNATQRNYLKRLLREAYRLQRHELMETLSAASVGLHGALIARKSQMDFSTAQKEVKSLLDRLVSHLHSTFDL